MQNIDFLKNLETPCYVYNLGLLQQALDKLNDEAKKYDFNIHYAMKANANHKLLTLIARNNLGADCVSGNEILRAIECGFNPNKIVFAGVGKSDKEINIALDNGIFCFNCESQEEILNINKFASEKGVTANIAIRVNPDIDAHTHKYITTGVNDSKFGIYLYDLDAVIGICADLRHINLIGLHFHIGSQIVDMNVFKNLCLRVNEIQDKCLQMNIKFEHINFGGGLGIEYDMPYSEYIADFERYFKVFDDYFNRLPGQAIHFELGRSIVAHCGDLVSTVLYTKTTKNKKFIILDAGMNNLMRPALYQAYHKIENVSSNEEYDKYDVVGPICESSDCFAKDVLLNKTKRGDIIVIHSSGAYGEVMASQYNLRDLANVYFVDNIHN